jgi:hypothetical protein
MNEILVKFFSARLLVTLDMNQLFRRLFEKLGECQITFVPMTPEERARASTDTNGIEAVNDRFWILLRANDGFRRQSEIEEEVVHFGQK